MGYIFMRYPKGLYKAITLSYDDGSKYDRELVEIADKYGIKLTLNVNGGLNGPQNDGWRLSGEEIKGLISKGGHEIAIHCENHLAPGKVSTAYGIKTVLHNRLGLENLFGKIIKGMAYPDSGIKRILPGNSKEEIKLYLKSLGISYARTLGGDNNRFELPDDFYEWVPTAHTKNPKLMEWLDEFLNTPIPDYIARRESKLFYLWGHSYEFNRDGNWEIFENFCKEASGREDVWYATNIEIYDYIRDFNRLDWSADNSMVYNPTCREIWFEDDKKLFSIKPDETLVLN